MNPPCTEITMQLLGQLFKVFFASDPSPSRQMRRPYLVIVVTKMDGTARKGVSVKCKHGCWPLANGRGGSKGVRAAKPTVPNRRRAEGC